MSNPLIEKIGLGYSANLFTYYHDFNISNPLADLSVNNNNLNSLTSTPTDSFWSHEFNISNPLADSSINGNDLFEGTTI
jgi:hypothetical protein